MVTTSAAVCVRVECKCFFLPNTCFYPKHLIGLHRINADDPRAKVGSDWTSKKEDGCEESFYPAICLEAKCWRNGRVREVIANCKDCPYKDSSAFICPIKTQDMAPTVNTA